MGEATMTIRDVRARAVVAPLERPIRTAVGSIPSAPLVLIDLATEEGVVGRSYIFGYAPLTLKPLVELLAAMGAEMKGRQVAPVARMRDFDRRFRLLGWQGLVGMAVSGLDMALWDALGQALGQPLVRLLGGEAIALRAYDSYGLLDPVEDRAVLVRSVEAGFRGIKIKLGDGDLDQDVRTVAAVRDIIGPDVALMVDFNQSLTVDEAIRRIERLARFELAWVEEPVAAEDLQGHASVRRASAVPIQTGENWWFPRDMERAVTAGASDFAMLDVMKIGGVTGWLRAMGQAQAASMPVSSHLFIEASAHLLAVTPTAHWLECLDVAGSILADRVQPLNGTVTPRGPGLGLAWDETAVERYAA